MTAKMTNVTNVTNVTRWVGVLAALALVAACSSEAGDRSGGVGSGGSTGAATDTVGPTTTAAALPIVQNPAPPVPDPYRAQYDRLAAGLEPLRSAVASEGTERGSTVLGGHLLAANGNRGEALLAPATLEAVDVFLSRFAQLGLGGVTLTIAFPMLSADYPRSAEYLRFYEQVVAKVRAYGMTVAIELNAPFSGTVFSRLAFEKGSLDLNGFVAGQRQMAQTIIDHLAPDYLAVFNEPDTFSHNLGLHVDDPATATEVVRGVLDGLDRRQTKVGAGTGTWSTPDYVEQFVTATSIDFVSLHLYPVNAGIVDNLERMVAAADGAGKPVVLDEAWLYKAAPGDAAASSNVAAAPTVFVRDSYSFFQPLDQAFLELTAGYARQHRFAYVSPFWTGLFFSYLDVGDLRSDLTYAQASRQLAPMQYANAQAGEITETGALWGRLATG